MRVGEHLRSGPLDVYLADSPAPVSRAGIVVPRYGRSVVARNRLKRRLRNIVRTCWLPGARRRRVSLDILVRARRDAYGCSYEELRGAIEDVTRREAGR